MLLKIILMCFLSFNVLGMESVVEESGERFSPIGLAPDPRSETPDENPTARLTTPVKKKRPRAETTPDTNPEIDHPEIKAFDQMLSHFQRSPAKIKGRAEILHDGLTYLKVHGTEEQKRRLVPRFYRLFDNPIISEEVGKFYGSYFKATLAEEPLEKHAEAARLFFMIVESMPKIVPFMQAEIELAISLTTRPASTTISTEDIFETEEGTRFKMVVEDFVAKRTIKNVQELLRLLKTNPELIRGNVQIFEDMLLFVVDKGTKKQKDHLLPRFYRRLQNTIIAKNFGVFYADLFDGDLKDADSKTRKERATWFLDLIKLIPESAKFLTGGIAKAREILAEE